MRKKVLYIQFSIVLLLSICFKSEAYGNISTAQQTKDNSDSVAILSESRTYIRENLFIQNNSKSSKFRIYSPFKIQYSHNYYEMIYATRSADMKINLWNGDLGVALNKAQQRYLVAVDLESKIRDSIPKIGAFCVAQTLYDVGYVSLMVNKQARSLFTLDKAVSILDELNQDGPFFLALKTDIYSAYVQAFIKSHKVDSAIAVANRYKSCLPSTEIDSLLPQSTKSWHEMYQGADLYDIIVAIYTNTLNFARINIANKEYKEALSLLNTASQWEQFITSPYCKGILASERLHLEYLIQENYQKPSALLPKIDAIISIEQFLGRKVLIMEAKQNKALLLYQQGHIVESATLFKETSQFFLTKSKYNIASLQNVIDLGLEKRDMELKAKIATIESDNAHKNAIILLLITLFLVCICGIIVFFLFKTNRVNKELSKRIQELAKAEEKIVVTEAQMSDNEIMVFEIKKKFIEDRSLLTDTRLNRKMLAELLFTNEVYLSNAIKDVTGMSVNDFINRQKLNYALDIISRHPDIKMDVLANDSGFGSRVSLFRVFKKELGLSPTTYIKSL